MLSKLDARVELLGLKCHTNFTYSTLSYICTGSTLRALLPVVQRIYQSQKYQTLSRGTENSYDFSLAWLNYHKTTKRPEILHRPNFGRCFFSPFLGYYIFGSIRRSSWMTRCFCGVKKHLHKNLASGSSLSLVSGTKNHRKNKSYIIKENLLYRCF